MDRLGCGYAERNSAFVIPVDTAAFRPPNSSGRLTADASPSLFSSGPGTESIGSDSAYLRHSLRIRACLGRLRVHPFPCSREFRDQHFGLSRKLPSYKALPFNGLRPQKTLPLAKAGRVQLSEPHRPAQHDEKKDVTSMRNLPHFSPYPMLPTYLHQNAALFDRNWPFSLR